VSCRSGRARRPRRRIWRRSRGEHLAGIRVRPPRTKANRARTLLPKIVEQSRQRAKSRYVGRSQTLGRLSWMTAEGRTTTSPHGRSRPRVDDRHWLLRWVPAALVRWVEHGAAIRQPLARIKAVTHVRVGGNVDIRHGATHGVTGVGNVEPAEGRAFFDSCTRPKPRGSIARAFGRQACTKPSRRSWRDLCHPGGLRHRSCPVLSRVTVTHATEA